MIGIKAPETNNIIPVSIKRIVVCAFPDTGIALPVAVASAPPVGATTNVAVVVCVAPVVGSVIKAVMV